MANWQKTFLILVPLLIVILVAIPACINRDIITRPTYHAIDTIQIGRKNIVIDNPKQITAITNEINSLNTGYWKTVTGKEASSALSIIYYKADKPIIRYTIGSNFIIEHSKDSRQLGIKGYGRSFDFNQTPELKKIWAEYGEK